MCSLAKTVCETRKGLSQQSKNDSAKENEKKHPSTTVLCFQAARSRSCAFTCKLHRSQRSLGLGRSPASKNWMYSFFCTRSISSQLSGSMCDARQRRGNFHPARDPAGLNTSPHLTDRDGGFWPLRTACCRRIHADFASISDSPTRPKKGLYISNMNVCKG